MARCKTIVAKNVKAITADKMRGILKVVNSGEWVSLREVAGGAMQSLAVTRRQITRFLTDIVTNVSAEYRDSKRRPGYPEIRFKVDRSKT